MSLDKQLYIIGVDAYCNPTIQDIMSGEVKVFEGIMGYNAGSIDLNDGSPLGEQMSIECFAPMPESAEQLYADWMALISICQTQTPPDGGNQNGDEGKVLENVIWVYNPDNPKEKMPLYVFSNPNCVATDIEGTQIVNLNNYDMTLIAGTVIPEKLAKLTIPNCRTICLGPGEAITYQDILDLEVGDGLLLPQAAGGVAPTGLLNPKVMVFQIGQSTTIGEGEEAVTKKSGSSGATVAGDNTVSASATWCPPEREFTDEDCDNHLVGEDLATEIVNNSATSDLIFTFCAEYLPFDADDANSAVV